MPWHRWPAGVGPLPPSWPSPSLPPPAILPSSALTMPIETLLALSLSFIGEAADDLAALYQAKGNDDDDDDTAAAPSVVSPAPSVV